MNNSNNENKNEGIGPISLGGESSNLNQAVGSSVPPVMGGAQDLGSVSSNDIPAQLDGSLRMESQISNSGVVSPTMPSPVPSMSAPVSGSTVTPPSVSQEMPVPPAAPVMNTGSEAQSVNVGATELSSAPVASPTPVQPGPSGEAGTQTGPVNPSGGVNLPPVAPVNYDIPSTINNFDTTPVFNNIGMVPPANTPPVVENPTPSGPQKKKEGVNKLIFVMIVILAIAAVGVGVYIFLHIAQDSKVKNGVKPKNVEIEVGSSVSNLITDYAEFNGVDYNTCDLDISAISDTKIVGSQYSFSITCNGTKYTGSAKIVDKTPPTVQTKDVTVQVGEKVKPEDFIASCSDNAPEGSCSYAFKDEAKIEEYLKKESDQPYYVELTVKDGAGNTVDVSAKLIVTGALPEAELYVVCEKTGTTGYKEVDKLGIVESEFNGYALRNYTFELKEEDYNNLKKESEGKKEITYQNMSGAPTFDDSAKTLTLMKVINNEQLSKENGSTLPTNISELKALYESKNYSCKIGY